MDAAEVVEEMQYEEINYFWESIYGNPRGETKDQEYSLNRASH